MSSVLDRTEAASVAPGVDPAPRWRGRHVMTVVLLGLTFGVLRMAADGDGDAFWGARAGIDTVTKGLPRHDT